MIDPKSFINDDSEFIKITGSFGCDGCHKINTSALWNMDTKEIKWTCMFCNKDNEASL